METNIAINWHNMGSSAAVEADVRKRYKKLLYCTNDITAARISIDQPHHPSHKPHAFRVLLELQIPGTSIISQQPTSDHGDVEKSLDVYALIHRAFDAARRQLLDHNRLRQGQSLRHKAARLGEAQLNTEPASDPAGFSES